MKNDKFRANKIRLCGWIMGDGCITCNEVNFYPDDASLIKLFEENFLSLYGKKVSVFCLGNYFRVRVRKKSACIDLLNEGKFKSLTWRIPSSLFITKKDKREWLMAFFDCEAYVGKKQLQIQSVNSVGLKQIQKLLGEFQIESKIYSYERKNPNWNTNYILNIAKKDSRKRYLKEIGFNHMGKSEMLKQTLARVS